MQCGKKVTGVNKNKYQRIGRDLEHELAHGFELFSGVVLSMKERVVGHLPQLHHYITQLPLCRERTQGKLLPIQSYQLLVLKNTVMCTVVSLLSPLTEALSFLKRV